ncbi:MAG: acyl-CoA dehydrogenase [Candidatus Marinimicrobia bacterium]|nr:acyl-CoA dehydrogenase [Candidatus Neomarinimicrobiota bacterium]|tara:strand:+ start:44308 stop:45465 length:1158 start_codon:yes stop_codon:yes gene_type:complete
MSTADLNLNLTDEQLLVKQTAREFAESYLEPGVIERDDKSITPLSEIKEMGKLGFLGMMVPEEWNGSGMDTFSYVLAMEEVSRVDASAGVIMSVNNSLVCQIIVDWCSEEQKEKYLTKLSTGEWLGAFSLSEPQSGSDASNMNTFAEKNNNSYILNGTKNWVTNGISSDVVIVFALTEKNVGHKGISAFIVEKGTQGLSMGKKEDKLGIRGSDTCELYFDNCRIPIENRIGKEGEGFNIALKTLNGGRIGIATQALGISRASLEKSLEYSKERKQFGKTLNSFEAIQSKLAQIATRLEAARLLTWKAAKLKDSKQNFVKEAAMAKLFASQLAVDASRECVQIFGGYGYMQEYGVERLMRDAKITQIYEGTSEIQELIIFRCLNEE